MSTRAQASATRRAGLRGRLGAAAAAVLVLGATIAAGAVAGPNGAILALAAALYVALFVLDAPAALLGYLAIRPLVDTFVHDTVTLGTRDVGVGKLWGAGLLVVLVAFLARERPTLAMLRGYAVPLTFLGAYLALTLTRPGADFALTNGSRLASWLLVVPAIERLASSREGQRRTVLAANLLAALLVVVVALAIMDDRYGAAYYDLRFDARAHQTPFAFAALAVLTLPFVLAALAGRAWPLLPATLAGLLVVSVVLSFSRATYAALALVLVAFAASLVRRGGRRVLAPLAVVGLAGAGTIALVADRVVERFVHGSPRLELWRIVTENTVDEPVTALVGGGAQASQDILYAASGNAYWSHNDFVELLATGGALLVVLYVALVAWMAWTFWALVRDSARTPATRAFGHLGLGALAGFLAISVADGLVFSAASLLLGMQLGLARGLRKTRGATALDRADPARRRVAGALGTPVRAR